MTIVVTGFEAYGQVQVNPSAQIVEHLAHTSAPGTVCQVLPTEFAAAERRIRGLIQFHQPETVVCLGVAPAAAEIRLERLAVNLDNARQPDNSGYQPLETAIVAGGSPTLRATLPLERMLTAVAELGVPVVLSDDAGRYVCNHVMYAALDEIARAGLSTRCGFIHVPLCTVGVGNADHAFAGVENAARTLRLADMIAAVERCIAIAAGRVVGAPRT